MRPTYGDDYAIACCVSAMRDRQGDAVLRRARQPCQSCCCCAINGGRGRELKISRSARRCRTIEGDVSRLRRGDGAAWTIYRPWLAKTYVTRDEHHPLHARQVRLREAAQMALHDTDVRRTDGLRHRGPDACMADSLSAIKYAKVKPIRDPENGLIVDFEIEGDFPQLRQRRRPRRRPSPASRSSKFYRGAQPAPAVPRRRCTRCRF